MPPDDAAMQVDTPEEQADINALMARPFEQGPPPNMPPTRYILWVQLEAQYDHPDTLERAHWVEDVGLPDMVPDAVGFHSPRAALHWLLDGGFNLDANSDLAREANSDFWREAETGVSFDDDDNG